MTRMNWIMGTVLAAGLLGGCGVESTDEIPLPAQGADGPAGGGGAVSPGGTTLAVTPETAKIRFVGTKDDGRHDGGFGAFSGTVTFDPGNLAATRFALEIDTTSIWTDNEEKLTPHLKSADFFDVNTYPKATFATTGVTAEADGSYAVTGDLTLHGVTKSISFPATIVWTDPKLLVEAAFTIDRQDFGISYGTGKVHDDVAITAAFSASR